MYMYQPWFQQGIFLSAGSTGMMLIIKQFYMCTERNKPFWLVCSSFTGGSRAKEGSSVSMLCATTRFLLLMASLMANIIHVYSVFSAQLALIVKPVLQYM